MIEVLIDEILLGPWCLGLQVKLTILIILRLLWRAIFLIIFQLKDKLTKIFPNIILKKRQNFFFHLSSHNYFYGEKTLIEEAIEENGIPDIIKLK